MIAWGVVECRSRKFLLRKRYAVRHQQFHGVARGIGSMISNWWQCKRCCPKGADYCIDGTYYMNGVKIVEEKS